MAYSPIQQHRTCAGTAENLKFAIHIWDNAGIT